MNLQPSFRCSLFEEQIAWEKIVLKLSMTFIVGFTQTLGFYLELSFQYL